MPFATHVDTHVRQDIAEGVRWLLGSPPVRTLALIIVVFNVTWAAPWSVLVLWSLERVGIGRGRLRPAHHGVGARRTRSAPSAFGFLEKRVPLATLMRAVLLAEVLFHLAMALTTSPWAAYPLMFFFGAYAFVWGTLSNAVRQRAVPTEFQGRVGSVYMICVMGGMLVGSFLGGLIASQWGVTAPWWFAFAGVGSHPGARLAPARPHRARRRGGSRGGDRLIAGSGSMGDGCPRRARRVPAGADVVATDPATLEKYRFDWSRDTGAGTAVAVVRAESADQVQTAVRWAAHHRVPVVPRGAGIRALRRRQRGRRRHRAQPGADARDRDRRRLPGRRRRAGSASTPRSRRPSREHGLWYPPDPSSYEICSIGGNVATNAGGLCCVKYGVTTDYVLGLDVVLADGTLVTLGGKRIKDVAGLSLLKLFVGREGTLGIVTRAILRLVPLPLPPATLVASFADGGCGRAGRRRRTPHAAALDDRADGPGVDQRGRGLCSRAASTGRAAPCWSCSPTRPGTARVAEIAAVQAACEAAGAAEVVVTDDPEEGEMFVAARRLRSRPSRPAAPCCSRTSGCRCRCCPTCSTAVAAIATARDVEIPVVAHAGDGNTHPIIVYRRATRTSERRARAAFDDILAAASGSAAPSPASTAWAAPRRPRCPTSSARTSWH